MAGERKLGRAGVVSSLLRIADAVCRGEADGKVTITRLRSLADRIEAGASATPAKASAGPSPEVEGIFLFWQRQLGHPTAKLTPGRRSKIEARLKDYSVEMLRRAIVGCSSSAHHMGKNDTKTRYDGLELILRNGENVERFANMAAGGTGPPQIVGASDEQMAEIERLQDEAMEALGDGQQERYEQLEARLTELRRAAAQRPA